MKFFDAILLWFIRQFSDLVKSSFESDGRVELLEMAFDLMDDVSYSVFNK